MLPFIFDVVRSSNFNSEQVFEYLLNAVYGYLGCCCSSFTAICDDRAHDCFEYPLSVFQLNLLFLFMRCYNLSSSWLALTFVTLISFHIVNSSSNIILRYFISFFQGIPLCFTTIPLDYSSSVSCRKLYHRI